MNELDDDSLQNLFLEQTLTSKTLTITHHSYVIVFTSFALIFIIFGTILILNNYNINSVSIEYGNICQLNTSCFINFTLKAPMDFPFSINYEIDGLFQSHYYSIHSRSDEQLEGVYVRYDNMKRCSPFRSINDDPSPNNWILPCGVQAYSIFNDSFEIVGLQPFLEPSTPQDGIDPSPLNSNYQTGNKWLDNATPKTGLTLRRLGIWMDTAPFKHFRRIWGITENSLGSLPAGDYTIKIQNNYNISSIGGKKYVVLVPKISSFPSSTFLGIIFISSGVIMQIGVVAAFFLKPKHKISF